MHQEEEAGVKIIVGEELVNNSSGLKRLKVESSSGSKRASSVKRRRAKCIKWE